MVELAVTEEELVVVEVTQETLHFTDPAEGVVELIRMVEMHLQGTDLVDL
jgi:hypothetical protein